MPRNSAIDEESPKTDLTVSLRPFKLPTPPKPYTRIPYASAEYIWHLCKKHGIRVHHADGHAHAAEHAKLLDQHMRGMLSYGDMTLGRLRDLALQRRLNAEVGDMGTAVAPYTCHSLIRTLENADCKKLVETGKTFDFMSLPPELRNRVYENVMVDNKRSLVLPKSPALFHVSRQIQREGVDVYFRHNTFVLPLESDCQIVLESGRKERSVNVQMPAKTWQWIKMMGGYFLPRVRTLLIKFKENFSKSELQYFGRFLPPQDYARYTANAIVYQLDPRVYERLKSIAGNPKTRRLHQNDLLALLHTFGGWRSTKSMVKRANRERISELPWQS